MKSMKSSLEDCLYTCYRTTCQCQGRKQKGTCQHPRIGPHAGIFHSLQPVLPSSFLSSKSLQELHSPLVGSCLIGSSNILAHFLLLLIHKALQSEKHFGLILQAALLAPQPSAVEDVKDTEMEEEIAVDFEADDAEEQPASKPETPQVAPSEVRSAPLTNDSNTSFTGCRALLLLGGLVDICLVSLV